MLRKWLLTLGIVGATQQHFIGFSKAEAGDTPEAALLALENAYRNKDLDAAIRWKDFNTEARLMAKQLGGATGIDEDIVKSLAETLELSFRADIQENGFPNFSDMKCTVTANVEREPGIVALDEVCVDSSGNAYRQVLLASKNQNGWRIVGIESPQP